MHVPSLKLVYFSPTGTTKRIVEGIATGLRVKKTEVIDCTKLAIRTQKPPAFSNELVIMGAPVYGGRIPLEAAEYFGKLKAENVPAVPVAVYGNRHYDSALRELTDIAMNIGCKPIAGGVFIGEHSNSTEKRPIAHGRPDAEDLQKAQEFGTKIQEKLEQIDDLNGLEALQISGDAGYQDRKHFQEVMPKIAPKTSEKLCTKCRKCAKICPTAAISQNDVMKTARKQCIACFACIKICPSGAREMKNILVKIIPPLLHLLCHKRKEPEMCF